MSKLLCLLDLPIIGYAVLTSKPGEPIFTAPFVAVAVALVLTGAAVYKEHLDDIRYRKSRKYLDNM